MNQLGITFSDRFVVVLSRQMLPEGNLCVGLKQLRCTGDCHTQHGHEIYSGLASPLEITTYFLLVWIYVGLPRNLGDELAEIQGLGLQGVSGSIRRV